VNAHVLLCISWLKGGRMMPPAQRRIPTVLVTHDGGKAFSLGDRFLVMQAGSLRPHPASDLQEYALG